MRAAGLFTLAALTLLCGAGEARADAPVLLRAPLYGAPDRGGPGDLLLLAGSGFAEGDRVVYQVAGSDAAPAHPGVVPDANSATAGTAEIVKLADPADAITVRLPAELRADRPLWFWVVNAAGEWSAPVAINDPRPLWISPAQVHATADPARLGRVVRVVGRNLGYSSTSGPVYLRLSGPATYRLASRAAAGEALGAYVREAVLPARVAPGLYAVALSADGMHWLTVPDQQLQVVPDPLPPQRFDITDARFGQCRPDDSADDSPCLRRALQAAQAAGGGVVALPAGRWDLDSGPGRDGFMLAPGVSLEGAGMTHTIVQRHGATRAVMPGAMLTLTGRNTVTDIAFTDDTRYHSSGDCRSLIQLGTAPDGSADTVDDVLIARDSFMRVGRGLMANGRPIHRLVVVHNRFGAFETALMLTGGGASPDHPYDVVDSVFRDNLFVPGSFSNPEGRAGVLASQIAASQRVDFSDNTTDGRSTEGLQDPNDSPGWRAAFFWSLDNSVEQLLVSGNRIDCPGDKVGDGEAVALDNSEAAFGADGVMPVETAGSGWVRVRGTLLHSRRGQALPPTFHVGQWITVVDGEGPGQTRRITAYAEDQAAGTVIFQVAPAWDVLPSAAGRTRVAFGRQYWQVYIIGNQVNQSSPTCRKANLSGPRGGSITMWAPIADSVIEGNQQHDTDGIQFVQDYSARTPTCPACANFTTHVTDLLIRGNRVDGEYDWDSDCSWSGIRGYFVASTTPESAPPRLGFGIRIEGNTVIHADGQRGGAITFARAGASGPPPGRWPFTQNTLISGNVIQDIEGEPPKPLCRQMQGERTGIRIEGDGNIHDTVLSGNRCEHVARGLADYGAGTLRLCTVAAGSCECPRP